VKLGRADYPAFFSRLEGRDTKISNSVKTIYSYDNANRLTSVNGQNYAWDNNGNLLSDGVNTYGYDQTNRLISVNGQTSRSRITAWATDCAKPLMVSRQLTLSI